MVSIENIYLEENLMSTLKIAAYFILLYEHFEDIVNSTVKEFYSNPVIMDGKLYETLDNGYISALKKKVQAGEEGKFVPYSRVLEEAKRAKADYEKDVIGIVTQNDSEEIKDGRIIRGSLCWLQNNGVITEADKKRILSIRRRRNTLVHELFRILHDGLVEDDAKMVADLILYHSRVNNWRFQQVEIPVMEIELPAGTEPEDVISVDDAVLQSMFRILFCNEGEAFKEAIEKLTGNKAMDNKTGGNDNANA